jgi:hypothetical protein
MTATVVSGRTVRYGCPTTTARYTHLTNVTENDSWETINELINTLQIAIKGV